DDVPHLQSPEAGLCSGPGGTWRQEGASALGQEAIPTMRNEAKALQDQEDSLCPREEDTVLIQGGPRCPIHHYLLVRTPKVFNQAKNICKRCYGGNLVSIHNYRANHHILLHASKINQAQVWIGGFLKGWFLWKKFRWTDGSSWNFGYWAPGQPGNGKGSCVALCTKGGHWRCARCYNRLPFICSY
uniref:Proteoglycan 3, pro eosinophil major basic protein 2 n=1 Tax=Cavia porcellus TaxID=10141 RepID=H0UU15_CAVPO